MAYIWLANYGLFFFVRKWILLKTHKRHNNTPKSETRPIELNNKAKMPETQIKCKRTNKKFKTQKALSPHKPKYLKIPHITKTHTRKKKPDTRRSSPPKSNLTKHQNKHKNQTNINIIEGGGASTRVGAKARTLHIFRVVRGKPRFRLAEAATR